MLEVCLVIGAPIVTAVVYVMVAEIQWKRIERELSHDDLYGCNNSPLVALPAPGPAPQRGR